MKIWFDVLNATEHKQKEHVYSNRTRKLDIPSWIKRHDYDVDVTIKEVTEELKEMREEYDRLERAMITGRALLQDLKEYKNDTQKAGIS